MEISGASPSGYLASGSGAPSKNKVAPATKAKTGPKAKAKAKPMGQDAENERTARGLLATYQMSVNAIERVKQAASETPEDWAWAASDLDSYEQEHQTMVEQWEVSKLTPFVQDLRAAVFSPQAIKNFKKRYGTEYGNTLAQFTKSKPLVETLEQIVKQLEDTAKVRGLLGAETPKKPKRASSNSASSADPATKRKTPTPPQA